MSACVRGKLLLCLIFFSDKQFFFKSLKVLVGLAARIKFVCKRTRSVSFKSLDPFYRYLVIVSQHIFILVFSNIFGYSTYSSTA